MERIAIPSNNPGGLTAGMSDHFGHADYYTLVDVENGEIKKFDIISNVSHQEGGCMVPVNLLASHGVNTLIASGMGMRPLLGFKSVGIQVMAGRENPIENVVKSYINGMLFPFDDSNVCGGGGAHW